MENEVLDVLKNIRMWLFNIWLLIIGAMVGAMLRMVASQ